MLRPSPPMPLLSPMSVMPAGSANAAATIAVQTTNLYPGCEITIGVIDILSINIAGPVANRAVPLLRGHWEGLIYDGSKPCRSVAGGYRTL